MRRTLCVECGPDVSIDEDGCCTMCGNGAIGAWLDKHEHPAYELARLRPVYEAAKEWRAHRRNEAEMSEWMRKSRELTERLDAAIDTALAKERG